MTTTYLTKRTILAIHAEQVEAFGGAAGVRDMGLVEAAVFRPQTGYYADVIEEAAALWESLSQNHPFIDGNKRTAFAATHVFLGLNGYDVTADSDAIYAFVIDLYETNRFTFDSLVPWLRANTLSP
jgi:death on curing protein